MYLRYNWTNVCMYVCMITVQIATCYYTWATSRWCTGWFLATLWLWCPNVWLINGNLRLGPSTWRENIFWWWVISFCHRLLLCMLGPSPMWSKWHCHHCPHHSWKPSDSGPKFFTMTPVTQWGLSRKLRTVTDCLTTVQIIVNFLVRLLPLNSGCHLGFNKSCRHYWQVYTTSLHPVPG